MKDDLSERIALVTGASRGIGREIALAFARSGAKVVLVARSSGPLEAAADEVRSLGVPTWGLTCDVAKRKEVGALMARVKEEVGAVDVLVNNAAANDVASVVMSNEERWTELYELNVFGVYYLTKAVLPAMIRRKWGRIVNVSSIAAKVGSAFNSAYASSKAAVLGLTRSVARETARLGITANAVCPWHVDSELLREAMARRGKMFGKNAEEYLAEIVAESPRRRLVTAEEVAAAVLFFASPGASAVTGQTLNVCGGVVME
jgi:3-oxoacyl-[acyl-carrier protein] reductase